MINKKNCLKGVTGTFFKCATPTTPPDVVQKDGTMLWIRENSLIRKSVHWGKPQYECLFEFKGFSLGKEKTGIAPYAEMKPYSFAYHAWAKDTSSEILEYLLHQVIKIDWYHHHKPLPVASIVHALKHKNSSRKVLELVHYDCDRIKDNVEVVKAIINHPFVTDKEREEYMQVLKA